MADEFRINFTVTYSNSTGSGLSRQISPGNTVLDQTVVGFYDKVQSVPTSSTTLKVLDDVITNDGLLFLRNLDGSNFITYGSSLLEFKLKPGEFAWQRVTPTAVIQIKADTAAVKVESCLFED